MILNLFENFDASTNSFVSLNWFMMIMPFILIPFYYWFIPSRIMMIWMMFMKFIYNEFKTIMTSKYESNVIIFLSLMIYLMLLNLLSLFPYNFTVTSHMSFNLTLSFTMWFSFFIFSWINIPMKNLIHMVPLSTPMLLMHFMVLIELISNLIRPLTLAIRMTANLIAGHLLFTLLGSFMSNIMIMFSLVSVLFQNLLLILEFSMCFIQAYVFSILSVLYFSESKH